MSQSFADLGVSRQVANALASRGINKPFPVQRLVIEDVLDGHDVLVQSPTGSGKTLAFGLPLVDRLPDRAKPGSALILAPTRELAAQIVDELYDVADVRGLSIAAVYGGVAFGPQIKRARKAQILVACPGRLEDLIQQGDVRLLDVCIVVVDEADRMADMGFLPAVRRILDATRPDRQTMLFSATLDGDVDVLVKRYQRNPKRHEVATSEEKQGDVKHVFWRAERNDRVGVVADLVGANAPAIVFCRTRHGADRLAKQLARSGVRSAPIHGSRSQPQRDRALADFKAGRVQALVATDVAARGIHVDDVSCVIHYDPPGTHKDYVHRSGRTGRAGADGMVVSLVGAEQEGDVRDIQRKLGLPLGPGLPSGVVFSGGLRPPEPPAYPAAQTNIRPGSHPQRPGTGRRRRR